VDLDGEGEFSMTSLKMTNISLTLLTLSTFTGTPKAKKTILFDDIVFTNAAFATRNDFITIGPHVSSRNFEIVMKNFDFQNLLFENTAYAVNIKMQIPNAIRIENFSYSNITGGFINLEPVSVSHDIDPVKVEMKNITALNNDFKFNTFIILRDYSHLTVDTWTLNRNSGYFRGTVASITGKGSSAFFKNCNFNNNNGNWGGVFYVSAESYIKVVDSTLFGNFAILSSIAYIANEGKIIIDNWIVSQNKAISIVLIEIFDSTRESIFKNNSVSINALADKAITLNAIDDPSRCVNLWFASSGYLSFISTNRGDINDRVTYLT
jgi:hypothetical protein